MKHTYLQQNCKNTIAWIKTKFKDEILILYLGDNNIVIGYWYQLKDNKLRTFTPLLEKVNC